MSLHWWMGYMSPSCPLTCLASPSACLLNSPAFVSRGCYYCPACTSLNTWASHDVIIYMIIHDTVLWQIKWLFVDFLSSTGYQQPKCSSFFLLSSFSDRLVQLFHDSLHPEQQHLTLSSAPTHHFFTTHTKCPKDVLNYDFAWNTILVFVRMCTKWSHDNQNTCLYMTWFHDRFSDYLSSTWSQKNVQNVEDSRTARFWSGNTRCDDSWTVLCYHPYLVFLLFAVLLSLHLVTF